MNSLARIAALGAILAAGTVPSHGGDYLWCANDGQSRSGGLACWYTTLEQCMAAVSGSGAFCMRNYAESEPRGHTPAQRRR